MKRFFIQNGALCTQDDVRTYIHTVIEVPQVNCLFPASSAIPCEKVGVIGLKHFVEVSFVLRPRIGPFCRH